MKLQIAFDLTDLDKALSIAKSVDKYCDIFEIGSLLLYKYGENAVKEFRNQFPDKQLVVDAKIVDRPKELITLLSQAGADSITILAGAGRPTIHTATSIAHELGKKIILDLVDANSLGQSALEAKSLGIDALLFNRSEDEQVLFLDKWEMVKGNTQVPVFISAHISRENIADILSVGATTIIISSSITKAENPEEEAAYFSNIIKEHNPGQ